MLLRIGIGLGILAVYSLFMFSLGNKHGSNAREVARYRAEIAAKNTQIVALNSTLERERAEAEAKAAQEDEAFSRTLPGLGKCILSKEQAEALNKIGSD